MIDDYRALAVFVAVADAGSFSAAARNLKLSTSVVSHHISRLETRLGVALFFRSTRSLSLTHEGQNMIDAARRMVAAGTEALDILASSSEQLVGALRISLPAFGSAMPLHNAVWAFARAHPKVKLSLHNSDHPRDLVREGFDLAIRLGQLADSSLKSCRIGVFHRSLVATPAYLRQRDLSGGIEAIGAQDFIVYSMLPNKVTLVRDEESLSIPLEHGRIEVDSVFATKAAVLASLGMAVLPWVEVEAELAAGALVDVLPDWKLPVLGIYAVWPATSQQKKLTRRFIDFLIEYQADKKT